MLDKRCCSISNERSGDWLLDKYLYIVFLVVMTNIACLISVNHMLIMADEKTGMLVKINLLQVAIQLTISILLVEEYGVFGVIAGKLTGVMVAQAGLFFILARKLSSVRLLPTLEYWISQVIVIITAVFLYVYGQMDMIWSLLAYLFLMALFLILIGFKTEELKILRLKKV